jgi:hypothetical protein
VWVEEHVRCTHQWEASRSRQLHPTLYSTILAQQLGLVLTAFHQELHRFLRADDEPEIEMRRRHFN